MDWLVPPVSYSRRWSSVRRTAANEMEAGCLDVVQQAEEVELVGRHAEVVEADRHVGVRVRSVS
jgi:hypothetical protein